MAKKAYFEKKKLGQKEKSVEKNSSNNKENLILYN